MTEGALAGLRILDASQGVAGPFAARLLGDLGADVIKIEPPEGDTARRIHPAQTSDPDPTSLFAYLNWNKRGIVADLTTQNGRTRFAALAATVDVLIESGDPGTLASLGLGNNELARANPRLVLVSVTPYGQTGPHAGWLHTEATDWATSGYQYFAGDPAREPLMLPGAQAEFHTAQAAALASLAALHERDRSGRGQSIDISIQEASLTTHAWNAVAWTHAGHVLRRLGSDLFRCADGWVYWMRRNLESNLFLLIDRLDLIDDPRFEEFDIWRDIDSALWDIVRAWCAEQPMIEVYRRAQKLRIAVTPVNTVADLLASEQLAQRDWFVTPPGTANDIRYPGPPFGMTDSPTTVERPAPTLDEHATEILAELASASPSATAYPVAASAHHALPLQGLRVVEVTGDYRVGVYGVFRPKELPGGANLHEVNTTEIYYMVEGVATLVTGGTMRPPGPPIEGTSARSPGIDGGVSRRVTKGDVIIIPGRTPHWFSELETDIEYLIIRTDPDKRIPIR